MPRPSVTSPIQAEPPPPGRVPADPGDRRVEGGLPAPGDENVGALGHETLRDGQADAGRRAGDDGDLAV